MDQNGQCVPLNAKRAEMDSDRKEMRNNENEKSEVSEAPMNQRVEVIEDDKYLDGNRKENVNENLFQKEMEQTTSNEHEISICDTYASNANEEMGKNKISSDLNNEISVFPENTQMNSQQNNQNVLLEGSASQILYVENPDISQSELISENKSMELENKQTINENMTKNEKITQNALFENLAIPKPEFSSDNEFVDNEIPRKHENLCETLKPFNSNLKTENVEIQSEEFPANNETLKNTVIDIDDEAINKNENIFHPPPETGVDQNEFKNQHNIDNNATKVFLEDEDEELKNMTKCIEKTRSTAPNLNFIPASVMHFTYEALNEGNNILKNVLEKLREINCRLQK